MKAVRYFDCSFQALSFDIKEVWRLMGYGDYVPSSYISSLIDERLNDLRSIVKPHFGYIIADGHVAGNDHVVVNGVELSPGVIITLSLIHISEPTRH